MAEIQPDKTILALAWGLKVAGRAVTDIQVGQPVTLAIRPEKLKLAPATMSGIDSTHVPAIVEEAIYIGTDTRYTARVADRYRVVIRVQNVGNDIASNRPFERGEQVGLFWATENALILTN